MRCDVNVFLHCIRECQQARVFLILASRGSCSHGLNDERMRGPPWFLYCTLAMTAIIYRLASSQSPLWLHTTVRQKKSTFCVSFFWLLLNGDGCAVLLAAWFSQSLQSLTLSVDNETDVQVVAHRRWQEKWRPINTQVSWKPALALSSTDRRRVQSSAPSEVHRSWMMTLLSRAGLLPSEILPQVDTEHKFRTKYWQSCTSLAPKLCWV